MQFLSSYGRTSGQGLYFATHDPFGHTKTYKISDDSEDYPDTLVFSVSVMPPDAAVQLSAPYTSEFPVVVCPFRGDWFDASEIYRSWVLPSAQWTKDGPVAPPVWLRDVTTWVNSHWQQLDIFNVTGGDPNVLLERMQAIDARFGLGPSRLAVHWYEFDLLGYEPPGEYYAPCPEEAQHCGFDTQYPTYLEPRSGFEEARAAIQDLGIRVVPYINGRIYDQSTSLWKEEGEAGAAKSLRTPTALANADEAAESVGLDLYNESYGSEALFAVMCPHDEQWQDVISSTVGALVSDYLVDGVYIDQIGAAGFKPCFDPSHGHPLGGGRFWVEGYRAMLQKTRKASNGTFLVTESNAEPFLGGVDVLLSLVAFANGNFALSSSYRMVPAFTSVYGGYFLAAGAEFFQSDLTDGSGDVFAAKLAQQFLTGAQLGWMSLGGRDNQDPPMGLFELLMSSDHDDAVAFLKTLSDAKTVLSGVFNDGRASRDLSFTVSGVEGQEETRKQGDRLIVRESSKAPRGSSMKGTVRAPLGLEYDAVASQAWVDDVSTSTSLTVLFVAVEKAQTAPLLVAFSLDPAAYGVVGADGATVEFAAVSLDDGSETRIGECTWPCEVSVSSFEVPSRGVSAVRISVL